MENFDHVKYGVEMTRRRKQKEVERTLAKAQATLEKLKGKQPAAAMNQPKKGKDKGE